MLNVLCALISVFFVFFVHFYCSFRLSYPLVCKHTSFFNLNIRFCVCMLIFCFCRQGIAAVERVVYSILLKLQLKSYCLFEALTCESTMNNRWLMMNALKHMIICEGNVQNKSTGCNVILVKLRIVRTLESLLKGSGHFLINALNHLRRHFNALSK